MKTRPLGNAQLRVSEIGLGCMGMSEFYGQTNENDSIATLHRALDLGINFFDTADMYGMGANEILLGKAFKKHWNKIVIATKFGLIRDAKEPTKRGVNGHPDYVRQACDASLKRLNVDVIDLYYLHRLDKTVPIEETVAAMAELVRVGKVRYIGLSEVSAKTLRRAHQVHPITALQSEYSLFTRDAEHEIIPLCEELHITFVAFSPLGRGFLTNAIASPEQLDANDYRKTDPRFMDSNFDKNQQRVLALKELAIAKDLTPAQLALAWLLAKSQHIVPIPGTKHARYLEENVRATEVALTERDVQQLDQLFPLNAIVGDRYTESGMKLLDE